MHLYAEADLAAPAPAGVAGPRKCFKIMSWNMGSLSQRLSEMLALLVNFSPHVGFLQEAKMKPHEWHGFRALNHNDLIQNRESEQRMPSETQATNPLTKYVPLPHAQ